MFPTARIRTDKLVLINPQIVRVEGRQIGEEGCLSIPGFREQVRRGKRVTLRAQDAKGEFEKTGEDLLARAFLHETDHLSARLYFLPSQRPEARPDEAQNRQAAARRRVGLRAMRLVFLGTPTFAVPSLERLANAGHDVLLVVTQPDRPLGRGLRMAISPVKHAAFGLRIPVAQPERVRRPEAVEMLRSLAPDAMVVVGYGQIIPQSIIDIPPLGIINVHASLLPKYRGAAPIQWAIVERARRVTGVTIMRIDAGLDTGDMLLKRETEIGPEENAIEVGAAAGRDGR